MKAILKDVLTEQETMKLSKWSVDTEKEIQSLTVKELSDIGLILDDYIACKNNAVIAATAISVLTQRAIKINKPIF